MTGKINKVEVDRVVKVTEYQCSICESTYRYDTDAYNCLDKCKEKACKHEMDIEVRIEGYEEEIQFIPHCKKCDAYKWDETKSIKEKFLLRHRDKIYKNIDKIKAFIEGLK